MEPRDYQRAADQAVWDYLRASPDGHPLIVLPTGAGKSLVIAMLIQQAIEYGGRVICLAHRKELLEQNREKILALCPGIQVGLYSAGLRRHDFDSDVICAGIQSVYRKALEFGRRELIIVDEAHLISDNEDSMYSRFIGDLVRVNPRARLVGLTATPYRTGEGLLAGPDRLFSEIVYEAFTGDLIAAGYLCQLTNKPTGQVDTSTIAIRGGEFVQKAMEQAFDQDDVVEAACRELVGKAGDRRSIIVFCSGVDHAQHVAEQLQEMTVDQVRVITGQTPKDERAKLLQYFRDGSIRWLVNVDVLTTGFDAPRVDCVAVLRATMSPGLFCQIVGRGLRLHPSKSDCLVLDFGGNIQRHGSLDSPDYGRETGGRSRSQVVEESVEREPAQPAEIICASCGLGIAARFAFCPECGASIPEAIRHQAIADTDGQLLGEEGPVEWVVNDVFWKQHNKKNAPDAPPTLCMIYWVHRDGAGGNLEHQEVREWICFSHQGFARTKAERWWQDRSETQEPKDVADALRLLGLGACRHPATITTVRDGKWRRIVSVDYNEPKPALDDLAAMAAERVDSAEGLDDWMPF